MTASMKTERVFSTSFIILSLAAFCALLVLIGLGTWQVKRLHWKEALIARVNTRIASVPVPLDQLISVMPDQKGRDDDPEYSPITVEGTFLHEHEFFYYATLNGKIGWHLYTPVKLDDSSGKFLFINRGFLPDALKQQKTRPSTLTRGVQKITGLFRWPDFEKPNQFIPDNDLEAGIFFWRDLSTMRTAARLSADTVLPFFVYADKQPDTLPVGSVTIVKFPNSHLAYAITWYGLALTLLGVYMALLISRARNRPDGS